VPDSNADSYDKFAGMIDSDVGLDIFKRHFLSDDGQYVLGKILERCKFMDPCENERDMALNNFAKELVATIYWNRQQKKLNIHRVIQYVRNKLCRT